MFERSHEEHNGHANFETWAFITHMTQTQELLNMAIYYAKPLVRDGLHSNAVGEMIVRDFQDWAWEACARNKDALLMLRDVGSFWRVDDGAVGRCLASMIQEESV